QAEVFFCLVQESGISNEQIAKSLNWSIRTVEKHFGEILIRLGVDNRKAAALKAGEFLKNPIG
ncbi:MAG: hypothetical protein HZA13_08865, partial [Nitrospirae bacterium]|nr:hypothetical protein [Nitrospirota bacterium]